MQNQDLNTRLEELKTAAQHQTKTYESGRELLYQNMVDTYLWWKDASVDDRYLKEQYKEAGIVTRAKKSNTPNFYPLVRLVWNIDISTKASTVSNWSKSLVALHQLATDDKLHGSNNLRGDLINSIHDAGGLSELRGVPRMSEDELFAEEEGLKGTRKSSSAQNLNAAQELLKLKGKRAKSVAPKAAMPKFPTAFTNTDDFVVMLARRNRTSNELEIIGSNHTETLVNQALLECTDIDRASVSPELRLIAEALQPHAVPAKLEKYRKTFFETSKTVKREQPDGKMEAVKESTALIMHGKSNKITVRKAHLAPSCVTIVQPKKLKLHTGKDLVLRGADRSWIERELLNGQKLPLYSVNAEHALASDNAVNKTRFSMKLDSDGHERKLYFYDMSELPEDTIYVTGTEDELDIKPDWKITANAQWLAELEAECFGRWIAKVKSRFREPHNKKIALTADASGMKLLWWWDGDEYDRSVPKPFSGNAKIEIFNDCDAAELSPRDAMLLFSTIPMLPLASDEVTIQCWKGSIVVDYETDLATFRSVLPAYSEYEAHAKQQSEAAKATRNGAKT